MKNGCRHLLMGCHPGRDTWLHHTHGKSGGALGVLLFLVVIGLAWDLTHEIRR
jgi:hypothetical protein